MTTTSNPQTQDSKASKRRGVVLVAVLVVVVLLSLAGYQYSDLMMAEYKVSENAHRSAQSLALANSGIHYAAALLSFDDNYGTLAGNPFNNPDVFRGKLVLDNNGTKGYFTLIAPPDPNNMAAGAVSNGVMDEGGKINVNALMQIDTAHPESLGSGQFVHDILTGLPNMTEEIANAIIDWLDPDSDVRSGGAENDYYLGLDPPYRCKNGPIDSIDELLLVKGVTRDLLYGTDWNRNGAQDPNETAIAGFDRGWSAFLTVHSREPNSDPSGKPYIYLKWPVARLQLALADTDLGEDLAKYIILFRQYGPLKARPTTKPPLQEVSVTNATVNPDAATANDNNFKSIFNLVDDDPTKGLIIGTGKARKFCPNPLKDPGLQRDLLPKLFAVATFLDPDTQPEIPARINVNTAPREVLATLTADVLGLTDIEIAKISTLSASLSTGGAEPIYQTPAWLLTEAQVSIKTLRKLDPFVTTQARPQVFRVQSVGYFEGQGPAIRVEAVVDANGGRPRILAWRNLTELGKGWTGDSNP